MTFSPFYFHETEGGSVTVKIEGEETPRSGKFSDFVGRNKYFHLIVHITDYSLDITGTYDLAPVAVEPFTVSIEESGYVVNLPEGCSNVKMSIQLKSKGQVVMDPLAWTCSDPDGNLAGLTVSTENGVSITSDALSALPTGSNMYTLTTTYGEIDLSFDVTINVRSLVDDEWTKSTTPTAPAPIIVEL